MSLIVSVGIARLLGRWQTCQYPSLHAAKVYGKTVRKDDENHALRELLSHAGFRRGCPLTGQSREYRQKDLSLSVTKNMCLIKERCPYRYCPRHGWSDKNQIRP